MRDLNPLPLWLYIKSLALYQLSYTDLVMKVGRDLLAICLTQGIQQILVGTCIHESTWFYWIAISSSSTASPDVATVKNLAWARRNSSESWDEKSVPTTERVKSRQWTDEVSWQELSWRSLFSPLEKYFLWLNQYICVVKIGIISDDLEFRRPFLIDQNR